MLRIRQEQMDALAIDSARRFEIRALEHLSQLWPAKVETLGDAAAFVRRTTARCAAAGMNAEADVVRLLDLLMAFGHDPPPQWIDAILDDPRRAGATRVDALLARAMEELERNRGLATAR